jgi:hypothetical protein
MSPKVREVASGQVKPYVVGHQRLGVANEVFNGVNIPDLVACHPALGQWYGVVPLHH